MPLGTEGEPVGAGLAAVGEPAGVLSPFCLPLSRGGLPGRWSWFWPAPGPPLFPCRGKYGGEDGLSGYWPGN